MVVRSYSVLALQLERFLQFSRDTTGGVTSFVEALSFPQCCCVPVAVHPGRIWCTIFQITCHWTWWTVRLGEGEPARMFNDMIVTFQCRNKGGESCEPIFGDFTGRYFIDFSDEDWISLQIIRFVFMQALVFLLRQFRGNLFSPKHLVCQRNLFLPKRLLLKVIKNS